MSKVKNFARFYTLTKRIPNFDNDLKEQYVQEFTAGRTSSLQDMTLGEYKNMCDTIEVATIGTSEAQFRQELKKKRSDVLLRMQRLKVDTSDWDAVDEYCSNPRIAGKPFRHLSIDELQRLVPKLEAILRKKPSAPMPAIKLEPHQIDTLIKCMSNQVPS